jgi:hypothetical protein
MTTITDVDVVTYEVVRNRLTAIVAQQSAVLKNVSGSPLVTEANDCNTGVYSAAGEVVTMGPHNLFHSGSMETVVNHIIADCTDTVGISDGDAFITNDPYKGALHMPDVTMVEPVFYDGVRIGWVGTCARREDHHHRVGGQPTGDEGQRPYRGMVDPLRVVDDAEGRLLGARLAEQSQHRHAHQEPIRCRACTQTQRDSQRVALRLGEPVESGEQRRAQLLQACVGQLQL